MVINSSYLKWSLLSSKHLFRHEIKRCIESKFNGLFIHLSISSQLVTTTPRKVLEMRVLYLEMSAFLLDESSAG